MPWLQAHLKLSQHQVETVELALEALGALSVTLGDAADEPMLEPAPGETPLWQEVELAALFEAETDSDWLRAELQQALGADQVGSLRLEFLADQAWERAWLDGFKPMQFGRRLWICPSGHQVDQADAVVVDLDPGLAFGTGTHPTTALCLEWLDSQDLRGKQVIDFGCGSGILAIAALKLGAARVIGIDHDPQAVAATLANAERNGVTQNLEVGLNQQMQPEPADVVLANILANVLVQLAEPISALVRPGGDLVLSGILAGQAAQVVSAYQPQISFSPPAQKEDWVRLDGHRS